MSASVSVIIPVYNASKYLHRLVHMFKEQTLLDFEVIMVDDGSTDDTVDIAINNFHDDERFSIVKRYREPKGSVTCRNIGFEKATGKYVIHLDADDTFPNDMLEKRVRFMENNPDCDFATFMGCSVKENDDGKLVYAGKIWGVPRCKDELDSFLSTDYSYSVWNNIYVRNKFLNVAWDEKVSIYTDFSYIVPAIINKYNHKYANNISPDYYYFTDATNSMCKKYITEEKFESTLYLFDKTLHQLGSLKKYNHYKKVFFEFVSLQYYRIMDSDDYEKANKYLEFVRSYFPNGKIDKMKKRYAQSRKIRQSNNRINTIFSNVLLNPHWLFRVIKNKLYYGRKYKIEI